MKTVKRRKQAAVSLFFRWSLCRRKFVRGQIASNRDDATGQGILSQNAFNMSFICNPVYQRYLVSMTGKILNRCCALRLLICYQPENDKLTNIHFWWTVQEPLSIKVNCPSPVKLHLIIIGSGVFQDGEETIFRRRCAEDITWDWCPFAWWAWCSEFVSQSRNFR